MTATQMIPAVGQSVKVRFEDLQIRATVRDVKMAYGRPRLLIEPVAGEGQQWVEVSRVQPIGPVADGGTVRGQLVETR